ncbi:MAG: V-type ATP synthase subunit I, partial [Pseudomonadota bacterium]
FLYVVVLSSTEPPDNLLPIPRTHVGSLSMATLKEELEAREIELEVLHDERLGLTRYLTLLREHLSEAESLAELAFASQQTRDDEEVFVLRGWVPVDDLEAVADYAEAHDLAMIAEDPAWDELPPTLLMQPQSEAAGVELATFYQVPHYRGWDPTVLLVVSFAVFFAMIVADAGYGILMSLGILLFWKKLGRTPALKGWRRLGLIISGATIVYGMLVGSYFGAPPPERTVLAWFAVLDINDFDQMMRLSVIIGAGHLVIAIGMNAWVRRHRRSAIAQLGWIAAILGALILWLSGQTGAFAMASIGLMTVGILAILIFTSERPVKTVADVAWRLFDGVKALTGAMGAFGDVLSYLRLFALGLASASLAITFNGLASDVMESLPGLGLLLGILLLLLGHTLNFGLAVMSGVV